MRTGAGGKGRLLARAAAEDHGIDAELERPAVREHRLPVGAEAGLAGGERPDRRREDRHDRARLLDLERDRVDRLSHDLLVHECTYWSASQRNALIADTL